MILGAAGLGGAAPHCAQQHLVAHNATSATAARRTYEVIMGAFACYEAVWLMRRPALTFKLQRLLAESGFPVRHLAISLSSCLFAPARVLSGRLLMLASSHLIAQHGPAQFNQAFKHHILHRTCP